MPDIQLVDVSFRDGNQSLWGATGVRTRHVLPIAPLMDRVGFRALDFTSSTHMGIAVRTHREDPWERIRLTRAAMPSTGLQFISPGFRFISWELAHPEFMELVYARLVANGIDRFGVIDPTNDPDAALASCRQIREAGGSEIVAALTFTISDVHDDPFYARLAALYAASPDVDTILLYDTAGVLEKDRLKSLVPGMVAKARGKKLEFHSNNLLGMSAKAYLDAIELGVSVLHTASRPMANGPSVPSTEIMVKNVELKGHTHNLDKSLFKPVADHFEAVGKAAGFLVNQYAEYDVFSIEHQIPGGMMGTFKAQLAQHNMSGRLDEVLEETARVRRELGYPGMATPFSQLVGIQAVLNIVTGKRYGTVPDEVVQYAAGFYGQPVAPVDPDILDRIMASARAKDVLANPPEQPTLEDLKKRYGTDDLDELILRATVPAADIAAMRAAGPVKRSYPLLSSPELERVRQMMKIQQLPVIEIKSAAMNISLRRRN